MNYSTLSISGVLLIGANVSCFNANGKSTEVSKRPNILFAISDDQSFQYTGFAGCKFVKTPAFDRVAREGIYFTSCYAGSPGCAPSRSTIVTGRYHWQNEQSGQHASSWLKKYVPFVDLLDRNGYSTGRTGKGVDPFQYARDENDSLWRKTDAAGIEHSKIRNDLVYKDSRWGKGMSTLDYFENFKYFMEHRAKDKPFFFWYGASEPHRNYEKDSWRRNGKKLSDATVPDFLPDNEIIRGDLLDFAVEIEWFDNHLQKMLTYLEEIGELENTIIIVTSDNGMPFPRGKALCYENGIHVPLAIRFPKSFPGKRIVDDPVSFADFAPTILELTGTSPKGMLPISGKSIVNILESKRQGIVDKNKKYVFAGRERHSSSRWNNLGYPQRMVRSRDYLLIWNLKPERWPAGAPQAIVTGTKNQLAPMFGIDDNGTLNSEWAFTDVDASPSKAFLVEQHQDGAIRPFFDLAYGKVPEYQLYHIKSDPYCLNNLVGRTELVEVEKELKEVLYSELEKSKDPRIVGPNKEIFDSYIRYGTIRQFPHPEEGRSF